MLGGYAFAATKFTTSSSTTISQLALYFYASPAGNIRFAVYRDNGGTPASQSLVGQTSGYAIGAGTGWHTYTLSSDVIQINSPGTYWLCLLMDKPQRRFQEQRRRHWNELHVCAILCFGFPSYLRSIPSQLPLRRLQLLRNRITLRTFQASLGRQCTR